VAWLALRASFANVSVRDLAHGIHPSLLAAHGLNVALGEVAARAPVPVTRLATVGATIRMASPPGAGTSLVAEVPLAASRRAARGPRSSRG
jgi:hypothetical protein